MHPLAKRVLLVERDYSARSPVVQAMTLGEADYHITKPWTLEQDLYRVISEFLAEWAKDQQAGFELFHVVGRPEDRSTHELRALLARFNVPFGLGAGNSAGQTALHLARHARQVTMLVRGDSLARSMSDYLIRKIEVTPRITVRLHTRGDRRPRR
jgi:thioredoxin reductase (NADPH)